MEYTAANYPTTEIRKAIEAGMSDMEIIEKVFRGDWSYIHFVENIRKVIKNKVASLD